MSDGPVYPLIGYGVGLVDGMVGLELEIATDREELEKRSGSTLATVMSPDAAVALGRDLIRRGELARRDAPAH